jgi:hypothetical protein
MPLPSPTTAWKYVKYVIRVSEAAIPAGFAYLDTLLTDAAAAPPDAHWVRAVVTFARKTPVGTSEDKGQFKFDLVNITGGTIDSSWTAADLNTVSTDLLAYLTALQPITSDSVTYDSIRYYRMSFNATDPGPGLRGPGAELFNPSGPPIRIDTLSKIGALSNWTPYQVAATVTWNTGWPKHWGRIYVPSPMIGTTPFDANGRFIAGYRNALGGATKTLHDALAAHDFLITVPVGQVGKVAWHGLLGVSAIVVDDIPDVQRRRRARQAAARYTAVS